MADFIGLEAHLAGWRAGDPRRDATAAAVLALAAGCHALARVIRSAAAPGQLAAQRGTGAAGDLQKELDVRANDILARSLAAAPVAALASEELEAPLALTAGAPVVVAVDPLDGSSNIETGAPLGTIFSILPTPAGLTGAEPAAFLQPGAAQIAAGYVIYGPQTTLALTLGSGTDIFAYDDDGGLTRIVAGAGVPERTREIAINASNYRHWDAPIRVWFDDCLAGAEGPRGEDFNLRWTAAMVAEAQRILLRGGVYLYPADARSGYHDGRLRLIYEGNPIAFLMEQAGARASTGRARMLDRVPQKLHERTPLIFGSRAEVERLERYHLDPHPIGETSALFGRRGLFRA
jgi:fructose-1,6-bisphosphatase I